MLQARRATGPLAISVVSVVEVAGGMRSQETTRGGAAPRFPAYLPGQRPGRVAELEPTRTYRRSHAGIGLGDYLVAGTAEVEGCDLATLNVRHFPVPGDYHPPLRSEGPSTTLEAAQLAPHGARFQQHLRTCGSMPSAYKAGRASRRLVSAERPECGSWPVSPSAGDQFRLWWPAVGWRSLSIARASIWRIRLCRVTEAGADLLEGAPFAGVKADLSWMISRSRSSRPASIFATSPARRAIAAAVER